MTIQVLDGNGVLQTVQNMNDFITSNPVGAQVFSASRAVSPAITTDSTKLRIVSASSVNNTLVSAAARVLRSIDIYNQAAYRVNFKLYDKATAPVAGTDVPFFTIPVSADSGYSKQFIWGMPLTLGLGFAITKQIWDTDTTAVGVEDVFGVLTWR
jgi:hypothetical protein